MTSSPKKVNLQKYTNKVYNSFRTDIATDKQQTNKMDVFDSFKPIFYATKPFCFFLHRITGGIDQRILSISPIGVIYTAIFICIYTAFYTVGEVIGENQTVLDGPISIGKILHKVQSHLSFGLSLFIILLSWINSKRQFKFLVKLNNIDISFQGIGMIIPSSILFSIIMVFMSYVLFISLVIGSYYFRYLDERNIEFYAFFVNTYTPLMIYFLCLISFINNLILLRQRFKLLNVLLSNIYGPNVTLQKITLVKSEKVTPVSTVELIKEVHDCLCDGAEEVNAMYAFQLLFIVMALFINVMKNLNNATTTIVVMSSTPWDGRMMPLGFLFDSLYMVFMAAVHLVGVATACTMTSGEANRTAVFVHKLLRMTSDDQLTTELSSFSQQLVHRKVTFTACGFFTLDATLLHAIVGAVTTYLVILRQFQA